MKIKYIGESFGVDSLTNGKVYEAAEENGMYRVIDAAKKIIYIQKRIRHR